MRATLAFAILLLALSSAAPEPEYFSLYAGNFRTADGTTGAALIQIESSVGRADRLSLAPLPLRETSAEAVKANDAVQPTQLASADVDTDMVSSTDAMSGRIDGTEVSLRDLCNALFTSAQDNDLPVQFFANLLWQESGLRNDVVSSKGALGIAQFMPETAAENGLDNPFDPMQAIPASARFLRTLRLQFGNLGFVAAAYNAGPHRVIDWLERRASLPSETRDYVLHITGLSVDAWRRIAVNDDALTFVRPLPCRSLPTFASMEQAQSPQALLDQAKLQQAARDEAAAEAAPKPRGRPHKVAERAPSRARREAAHARIVRERRQST
jgi:hypothetical protein